MFQFKKNYTGEKEFSLRSRQLDASALKLFSNKVSICFVIKPKKKLKKRKMIENYVAIDTFIVRGIQSTNIHNHVNSIYLAIDKSLKCNFFIKYPNTRFIYRFQLISITLSTNITNMDGEILITCKGLKDTKKCDTNGEEDTILGIILTENIENWEQLSATSSSVNIDLVDCKEVNGASNTAFSFFMSVYDLAKFDIVLTNSKREPIRFTYTEKKTPQVNFIIDVLKKI